MKRLRIPWRHERARLRHSGKTPGWATDCAATSAPEDSRAVPRALALLTVLALAGCGASAAAHRRTDAQIARRAGLALRDLPSGWKAKQVVRKVHCPAFRDAARAASAHVESGLFVGGGDRQEVSGVVDVFARPESARSAFAQISSPATRACFAHALRTTGLAVPGVRVRGVTDFVTRVDPLGDEQSGARFVVTYVYGRRRMVAYADLLAVRTGRAIASELYVALGAPLDGGMRYDLTALTARRLAGELRG
jgi:hypothetical protein